jgi:hypothetical protein
MVTNGCGGARQYPPTLYTGSCCPFGLGRERAVNRIVDIINISLRDLG